MRTGKKWTKRNVGMFQVQNQVILARFSTLPTLAVFVLGESWSFDFKFY